MTEHQNGLTYCEVCDIISKGFREFAKGKGWKFHIKPKGDKKLELEWY